MFQFTTRLLLLLFLITGDIAWAKWASKVTPEPQLYQRAVRELRHHQYSYAIKDFQSLQFQYPVGVHIENSYLLLLYAQYKQKEYDDAKETIDQFLRLYPRSQHIDYVYYMKGVVNFTQSESGLRRFFRLSQEQSIQGMHEAFVAFDDVLTHYPNSRYADDAVIKMRQIRNISANRALSIATFYAHQGAHVGAIYRALGVIQRYPGAPATLKAADILQNSYREVGLNSWAEVIKRKVQAVS